MQPFAGTSSAAFSGASSAAFSVSEGVLSATKFPDSVFLVHVVDKKTSKGVAVHVILRSRSLETHLSFHSSQTERDMGVS